MQFMNYKMWCMSAAGEDIENLQHLHIFFEVGELPELTINKVLISLYNVVARSIF